MPKQEVRITVCRNAQEIANAMAKDQTLGFTFVAESPAVETDVGIVVDIPTNGDIAELFVHVPVNAKPPPSPPTVSPPLTLVISRKINP
jgi:hypothetical protein